MLRKMDTLITPPSRGLTAQTKPLEHANAGRPNEPSTELTSEHMRRLWASMVRMFNDQWTAKHGINDDGTWQRFLRNYTEDEIRYGINALARERIKKLQSGENGYAPSLLEFAAFCRPKIDPAHRRFGKGLPLLKSDAETGSAMIDKLKRAIR